MTANTAGILNCRGVVTENTAGILNSGQVGTENTAGILDSGRSVVQNTCRIGSRGASVVANTDVSRGMRRVGGRLYGAYFSRRKVRRFARWRKKMNPD